MPLLEQLNPLAFRVSWNPPVGASSYESSTVYNISCQSVKRGIDSPPPITTEPGQPILLLEIWPMVSSTTVL